MKRTTVIVILLAVVGVVYLFTVASFPSTIIVYGVDADTLDTLSEADKGNNHFTIEKITQLDGYKLVKIEATVTGVFTDFYDELDNLGIAYTD